MLMIFSPLEQFSLALWKATKHDLNDFIVGVDSNWFVLSISNFVVQLVLIGIFSIIPIFFFSNKQLFFFSYRFVFFHLGNFLRSLVLENFNRHGRYFYGFFFFLFCFLLYANLTGMVPYSFAITSHLAVTLFFSFLIFFSATSYGVYFYGFNFLSLFFPPGAPFFLAPFLISIEIISYTARLFSLAIRLFANVMSGHTLLKILASFAVVLFITGAFFTFLIPMIIIILVVVLETIIGALQAYVFAILGIIYINESFYLH